MIRFRWEQYNEGRIQETQTEIDNLIERRDNLRKSIELTFDRYEKIEAALENSGESSLRLLLNKV